MTTLPKTNIEPQKGAYTGYPLEGAHMGFESYFEGVYLYLGLELYCSPGMSKGKSGLVGMISN